MKLAIDFGPLESVTLKPEFAGGTIGTVVSALLKYIFPIAGFALLLYLLYGGYHMMLSRGDPKAIQDAKAKITYALAGFAIIFVAYWVVQLVARILGLTDITGIFG
jgi:hypothetical protein